jgi:hypothetical protein
MFRVKEELSAQMVHYDVTVGAYLQLDQPRPLEVEKLAMLIPGPTAEEVSLAVLPSLRILPSPPMLLLSVQAAVH